LSNKIESWDLAKNKCENLTSHLVSILDSFEHSFITYYIQQNTFMDQIWIGFSAKTYNTTQVSFKWIDGNPNFVSYWANKQPSINETLDKTCVYQSRNSGNWSTDSCNEKKYFICKISTNEFPNNYSNGEKIGYCPNSKINDTKHSWIDNYEKSKYCYWFSVDSANRRYLWTEASYECRKMGGYLASFHSYSDLRLLSSQFQKTPDSMKTINTWIGLKNTSKG
jgi:hypothetical protein